MLTQALESYLEVRRAMGFALHSEGTLLQSFAKYSNTAGKSHICMETAIQWAGLAQSVTTRARRLGQVIRLARYLRAEDQSHEVPPAVFGCEKGPRPVPYIFSAENIKRLVQAASQLGLRNPFRGQTYGTFFTLLACTGLRVSEAIRLRFEDVTADGLIIRCSKFRKSRLVPLHSTAQVGLERYLQKRRPFAPFDDHVFVSLRRHPLLVGDAETAFRTAAQTIGLKREPGCSPAILRAAASPLTGDSHNADGCRPTRAAVAATRPADRGSFDSGRSNA